MYQGACWVLVVVNTQKSQQEIKHVYLKEAKKLRPDISC